MCLDHSLQTQIRQRENGSTTPRRRRKTTPHNRKRRRNQHHPQGRRKTTPPKEGGSQAAARGGEQQEPKGRKRRAARPKRRGEKAGPPKRRTTTQKKDWNVGPPKAAPSTEREERNAAQPGGGREQHHTQEPRGKQSSPRRSENSNTRVRGFGLPDFFDLPNWFFPRQPRSQSTKQNHTKWSPSFVSRTNNRRNNKPRTNDARGSGFGLPDVLDLQQWSVPRTSQRPIHETAPPTRRGRRQHHHPQRRKRMANSTSEEEENNTTNKGGMRKQHPRGETPHQKKNGTQDHLKVAPPTKGEENATPLRGRGGR